MIKLGSNNLKFFGIKKSKKRLVWAKSLELMTMKPKPFWESGMESHQLMQGDSKRP